MDLLFSIACDVLKIIITGTALLNELTLFAIPWICAPSAAFTPAPPFPHPALTSLAYAVAEPLYAALLAKTGIMPWILVFNTPQHLLLCQVAAEYLSFLGRSQTWLQSIAPPGTVHTMRKAPIDTDPELQPTIHEGNPIWRPELQACIVSFFLVQSVAASNVAFLLFAADLESKLSGENTSIMLFMGFLAVVFYLSSRYGDVQITQFTEKTPLWRRQPVENLKLHLGCLALVLFSKMTIRHLLNQSLLPILKVVSSRHVMPPLAEHMPPWLVVTMAWKAPWPRWITRLLSWAAIPVQIYAFYIFRNSLEKILAKEN